MSRIRVSLALVAASALALGNAAAFAEESDHIDHAHRLVRIGEASLHPPKLEIAPGDAFGWLNYSSQIATVSFDAATADKMLCQQRSSFRLGGDRIESGDIQARQFVSLCSLVPGTYPYRVVLRSGAGGSGSAVKRTLDGEIVVH
jgi:plastocyanin